MGDGRWVFLLPLPEADTLPRTYILHLASCIFLSSLSLTSVSFQCPSSMQAQHQKPLLSPFVPLCFPSHAQPFDTHFHIYKLLHLSASQQPVFLWKKLILLQAHYCGNMAGYEKTIYAEVADAKQKFHGRRNETVGYEKTKVFRYI